MQSRPLKVSAKQEVNGSSPIPPPPKTGKINSSDVQSKNQQTEEILNSILPPRFTNYTIKYFSNHFLYAFFLKTLKSMLL